MSPLWGRNQCGFSASGFISTLYSCKDASIVNFPTAVSQGMFSDVVVFFFKFCVTWNMFSVDFGTLSSEGYPQSLPKEAQWCHRLPRCVFSSICVRFGGPFWEAFSNMLHYMRHPVSKCFFFEASRQSLITILASFWEPFWQQFRHVFMNNL